MEKLWRLTVRTSLHFADAVAAYLEHNAASLTVLAPPRKDEALIEAIYASPPNRAHVMTDLSLLAALQKAHFEIEIGLIPEIDWVKKVAGDFPPLRLARWTIYGSHSKSAIPPSRFNLNIDATSAFGTGEHPTTKGCLLMLDRLLQRRRFQNLLDIGTGSGILAMAFAKAMKTKALAIESDALSVKIAKENVALNGLQNFVSVRQGKGYMLGEVKRSAPFELIIGKYLCPPTYVDGKGSRTSFGARRLRNFGGSSYQPGQCRSLRPSASGLRASASSYDGRVVYTCITHTQKRKMKSHVDRLPLPSSVTARRACQGSPRWLLCANG